MDDKLIITILIQTHGSIIKTDLTSEETDIFKDVRLSCGAGDFINYETNIIKNRNRTEKLKGLFVSDIDKSTQELIENLDNNMFIQNISFDKSIAIDEPSFFDLKSYINPDGVYLLSIHKGKTLIFPEDKTYMVSLLHIENLRKLAKIFNKKLPNNLLDESTILPVKKYIDMENEVYNDNSLKQPEKEERINKIQNEFYNILTNWKLTINESKTTITSIRLSFLVYLIKNIITDNCIINLLDYSCNKPSVYIPEDKLLYLTYAFNKGDIETGDINLKKYGGVRKKNRKNTIKKRKNNIKKNKKKYITRRRK